MAATSWAMVSLDGASCGVSVLVMVDRMIVVGAGDGCVVDAAMPWARKHNDCSLVCKRESARSMTVVVDFVVDDADADTSCLDRQAMHNSLDKYAHDHSLRDALVFVRGCSCNEEKLRPLAMSGSCSLASQAVAAV